MDLTHLLDLSCSSQWQTPQLVQYWLQSGLQIRKSGSSLGLSDLSWTSFVLMFLSVIQSRNSVMIFSRSWLTNVLLTDVLIFIMLCWPLFSCTLLSDGLTVQIHKSNFCEYLLDAFYCMCDRSGCKFRKLYWFYLGSLIG